MNCKLQRHRPQRKRWGVGTVVVLVSGLCLISVLYWCMRFTYLKGYSNGLDDGVDLALKTFEASEQRNLPEPTVMMNVSVYNYIYTETSISNDDCDNLSCINRNPLNIKARDADPWEGQVGKDKYGHAVFDSWEYGIRAGAFVLRSYAITHGIDTVSGVVRRFAEGNHEAYIEFVCDRLGVTPREKFNIIARMPELLRAMTQFESGMELPDKFFAPYDILTKQLTSSAKHTKQ